MASKSIITICSISLCVFLLILPIAVISQSHQILFNLVQKYNPEANFGGFQESKRGKKLGSVFEFISPPFTSELDDKYFSNEDIWHMEDVRVLVMTANLVMIMAFIASCALIWYEQVPLLNLLKQTRNNFRVILIAVSILGALMLVAWGSVFDLLHRILFPTNTFWQLDPATSKIIGYFPPQVFQELAVILFISWLLTLGVLELATRHDRIDKLLKQFDAKVPRFAQERREA